MHIKILSYNLNRRWSSYDQREPLINDLLNRYEFDIFCPQEYLRSMKFDKLEKNFERVETYMNPIFYNKDRFTYVSHFAAEHNKFVCVKLREGSQEFYVCNLHLNYGYYMIKETGRIKQLGSYLEMIKDLEDLPIVLTGDFNCVQTAETLNLMESFTNTYIAGKSLKEYTNNNYSTVCNDEIIDHTFVKGFKVIDYSIICDDYQGALPSDHNPVYSYIKLDI